MQGEAHKTHLKGKRKNPSPRPFKRRRKNTQGVEKDSIEQATQRNRMAEDRQISPGYDLNAKWNTCLDLSLRRVVCSSFAGALGGRLLFRSPVSRWASIAFGAGVGFGSAYSDCSKLFNGSLATATLTSFPVSHPSEVSSAPDSEDSLA